MEKKGCNYCTLAVSLCSRYTADSFCAGAKTIPNRASVHTSERWFRRNFCKGAKLRHAQPRSQVLSRSVGTGRREPWRRGCAAPISKSERHILDRCSYYSGQFFCRHKKLSSIVWTQPMKSDPWLATKRESSGICVWNVISVSHVHRSVCSSLCKKTKRMHWLFLLLGTVKQGRDLFSEVSILRAIRGT